MKKHVACGIGSLLCLLLSQVALAGFYVVDETPPSPPKTPAAAISSKSDSAKAAVPTKAASASPAAVLPAKKPAPSLQTYAIYPGSLKSNVERMVRQAHWGEVVWTLPYDYRWVGSSTMKTASLQEAVDKLLASYPVQAVFYEQNHIVEIKARPSIAYRVPEGLAETNDQPGALNARSDAASQEGHNG